MGELLRVVLHIVNPAVPSTPQVMSGTAWQLQMVLWWHIGCYDRRKFIVRMIPHHQEAVNTMIIVAKTKTRTQGDGARYYRCSEKKLQSSMDGWNLVTIRQRYSCNRALLTRVRDHKSYLDWELRCYMEDMVNLLEWAIDNTGSSSKSQKSKIVTYENIDAFSNIPEIKHLRKSLNDH